MRNWILTCTVLLALVLPSAPATNGVQAPLTQDQETALKKALQKYGWSIPVCTWPIRPDVKPSCVTVAQLTQKYPFHTAYISETIYSIAKKEFTAAKKEFITSGFTNRPAEQVIQKLLDQGVAAGCVPKGRNRGAITLGQVPTTPSNRLDQMKAGCDTNLANSVQGIDLTFGVLVGSASDTPSYLSLNPADLATYQQYVDECKSKPRTNQRGAVAEGGDNSSLTAEEQAKAAAAKKAREEAAAAAQVAADARTAAKKKKDDAAVAAQAAQVAAAKAKEAFAKAYDPSVSDAAPLLAAAAKLADAAIAAQAKSDQADKEAAAAQAKSDQADKDAAAAQAKSVQADKDLAIQRAKDDSNRDLLHIALKHLEPAYELVDWYFKRQRAIERIESGNECDMEGSGCGMTCEEKAKARIARDTLLKDKNKPKCNFDINPLPDDDRCYDSPGGVFRPSQATLAHALEGYCKMIQGIDGTCDDRFPGFFSGRQFDPCHGPLVMCAPDQSSSARDTGGRATSKPRPNNLEIKSVPLPAQYRGTDPGMWRTSGEPPR